MITSTAALAFAATLSLASPQAPISEIADHYMTDDLGWVLHNVGDLDGDGLDDMAAACAKDFEVKARNVYEVTLRSWAPGATRWLAARYVDYQLEKHTVRSARRAGEALAVLRSDGKSFELAIGAPGPDYQGRGGGAVGTFSTLGGFDRGVAWNSEDLEEDFGAALAALPDLDEDGRAELAIGAPGRDRVVLVSTTDRGVLGEWHGNSGAARFGAALAVVAGTSWADAQLAVGAPEQGESGERRGAVHLHRLGDGRLTRTVHGASPNERFGARLVVSDLGGSAAEELVVASIGYSETNASVCVIDTSSWRRSWTHDLGSPAATDGLRIDTIADVDRDGCRDVLVSFEPEDRELWPEALVLSGRDGTLVHAIRSYSLERSATGRAFLPSMDGVRLGTYIGFIGAGDHDGDGLEDAWLAIRSDKHNRPMFSSISLISGAQLNGESPNATSWVLPRIVGVRSPAACLSHAPTVCIADVPKHFVSERDDFDDHDSDFDCLETAFGRRVEALGDLDDDESDEIWVSGVARYFGGYGSRILKGSSAKVIGKARSGNFFDAVRTPDLDGDGRADYAIGASFQTLRFCEMVGEVLFYSSAKHKEIEKLRHPGGAYQFGSSLALIDDVDGDGVRDLAVGTPSSEGWGSHDESVEPRTCEVSLVSLGSKRHEFLLTLHGDSTGEDAFGASLDFGGDWNGDGVADLAVGASLDSSQALHAGEVHVYCGATWTRLETFRGSREGELFGSQVLWAPDLDGDGRAELVASAPGKPAVERGRVVVLSSLHRAVLYEISSPVDHSAFGVAIALGDLDGDRFPELVVGAPGAWRERPWTPASVSILELRSGCELLRIAGELPAQRPAKELSEPVEPGWPYDFMPIALPRFGIGLTIAKDLDGDGVGDLCIGSPTHSGPSDEGVVYALSGAELRKHWK
ncbi:MAG: hypothetical protein NTV21_13580 [Planctomycetota bacterium]|nr:hypothetical protein [Planctomycetota bacterium]